MGFKKVGLRELETSLIQSFLGLPLKHVEDLEILETTYKEQQIDKLGRDLNVFLLNEETLEYNYNKNGELENFIGTGNITVMNNSKKDRIWDVRISLSGVQNISLKNEDVINLGNFEPKNNKKINYKILDFEELPNPVKITEIIEVLNINTKNIYEVELNQDIQTAEIETSQVMSEGKEETWAKPKELKMKEKELSDETFSIEEEEENETNNIIEEPLDGLSVEQKKLEEIIEKTAKWTLKVKKLSSIVKDLKKRHKFLLKAKSKALNTRLKKIPKEEKIKKTLEYENSLKEIKSKINTKEDEIKKIEKESLNKEIIIKKDTDEEFNPQINTINSKLEVEQGNLEESIKNANEWTIKKKKLSNKIKTIKKEHKTLLKVKSRALSIRLKEISGNEETSKKVQEELENTYNPRINSVESKLSVEQANLEETIKHIDEWIAKRKRLSEIVKNLEKEHRTLLKAKSNALSMKLKEIFEEKKNKIKELQNQISENEDEITKLEKKSSKKEASVEKEVKAVYDPQIINIKSKLEVEEGNLDEAIKKANELAVKKKESIVKIKDLKKKQKSLFKVKSKDDDIIRIEEEFSRKEASAKNKVKDEFDPQINSVVSELGVEQDALEKISKNINEWNVKKKESSDTIKDLKKTQKTLLKAKSETLDMRRLNQIPRKEKIEKTSIFKIKKTTSQISEEEDGIIKFEKKPLKSVGSIENEVEDEFNPQINNIESKLSVEQKNFDEIIKKIDEWNVKKKELMTLIKNLKKKYKNILKTKDKALSSRLKKISEEKKIKINQINEVIKKKGSKDLKSSFKEKALKKRERLMHTQFKETSDEDIELEQNELVTEFDNSDNNVGSPEAKEEIEKKEKEDVKRIEHETITANIDHNRILLFNKQNLLKFTINLENSSKSLMENIRIKKDFSDDFSNFKYESKTASNIEIFKGNLMCTKNELKPGEKLNIIIYVSIKPKEKKIIGTGIIQLSYNYKDYLISGAQIEDFTAYSHAMHALNIKEKETMPNMWNCSLIFKNNSDLEMELKSILVLDKEKETKFIDLKFNSKNDKKIVRPGEKYISREWEIEDKFEPKFFRKLEYTVTQKIQSRTNIALKFEENIFEVVDLSLSKRLSEIEIKSFEEAEIENLINIKNIGTISAKGLLIREVIPADFILPLNYEDFHIRTSSGKKDFENMKILISPYDENPSVPHILEIRMNIDNKNSDYIIDVNEFLEIRYPIKAISPDYNKSYEFPLKVNSYYPKEKVDTQNYYNIEKVLSKNEQPYLKIIHKRRDLLIGKEIFPGRNLDEFAISIIINNNSNIEIKDIKIDDTISNSFQLISSNVKYVISESENNNGRIISFIVDRILPFQEEEIRYYVKNESGENIDYEELESFIFG